MDIQNRRFPVALGYTLIELAISLTILSILISAATPAMLSTYRELQLSVTADTLIRSAQLARMESVKRGHRVILCLSDNSGNCASSSSRVIVFADPDHTGSATTSTDLIASEEFANALSVRYNRPFLAYTSLGHANGTNGTFTLCSQDKKAELVIVSTLGRARLGKDYNGDGIVEKTPGHPASC